MAIEIVVEGQLEKASDREAFTALLKQVCEEKKLQLKDYDTAVIIDVCPEGFIECGYEDRYVSVAAQTNVAGAGFHAYVCTVIDAILQVADIELQVNDATGYYMNRDFEQLKYRYFYRWLRDVQEFVREHIDQHENLCISWPQNYYQPAEKKDCIVTPMGYLHKDDFYMRDVEDVAQDFFVWNDLEHTARYYRNCAMVLLWKECYFAFSSMNEYTDKIANTIIDYLEAAYDKDNLLPLPMDAYRSICQTIGREILIHHAQEMKAEALGYRNGVIFYTFGNWGIPVHGCSEKSYDKTTNTLHFMAPYQKQEEAWKWMMQINIFACKEENSSFMDKLEHPDDACETFQFENKQAKGRGIIENLQEYYNITVQVNCGKEMLFLECMVKEKQDIAMLKEWCQGIRHQTLYREGLQS